MHHINGSNTIMTALAEKFVAPLLSDHNFRRSGLVWNRARPGIVHVLDIQVRRWSDDKETSFTVNLGVLVEQVWRMLWDKPVPAIIREVDCFPRLRIGKLLGKSPMHKDIWWTICEQATVEVVGPEVRAVIGDTCLPWLDSHATMSAIATLAEDPEVGRHPAELLSYAALKYLVGARGEAKQILANMVENDKLKAWHGRVKGVSERLASLD